MNDDKQALNKQEGAHHNRRQNVFVMALFASQETLQDPGNPLGII
jgi:hypothetical protein